jgi:signal transduction histidine kinase/ActR/RegA family two-component response regulator
MFTRSCAIIDSAGRLVDWDEGFELEFAAVTERITAGREWADLIGASREREGFAREVARESSGNSKSGYDYRAFDQLIRVSETHLLGGGRCRIARDVTREGEQPGNSRTPTGSDGEPVASQALTKLSAACIGESTQAILAMRKRREARARQAQKDQAVGRLTSGIAHDFNNLLMVAISNAESILAEAAPGSATIKYANAIKRAVDRGTTLTRQLLAFTRQQPLAPRDIEIARLFEEFSELLADSLGEEIRVQMTAAPDVWPVTADPSTLETALLNLVVNARDAMPGGGLIKLQVLNESVQDGQSDELAGGDYVVLSVEDTGHGMTADTLEKACDPFFTTKNPGEGPGLGLSLVYGFARQSGGALQIHSTQGRGTQVRLFLPRGAASVAPAPVSAAPVQSTDRRYTILLVDDHDLVRTAVTANLESLNYRVLTADRGPAALKLLEGSEPIDLLFTDVVMPGGLSGAEVARRARALRPSIKVLFTSGFTSSALVQNGRLEPGVELLMKPYDLSELVATLQRILEP